MRLTLLASLAFLAACVTAPAVDPSYKLRPETGPECTANCEKLGMRLGAVVLIHNSAGCVCQPREVFAPGAPATPPPPPPGSPRAAAELGGGAIAGGAFLVALEEEAQRQRATQPPGQSNAWTPAYSSGVPGFHR
jgi:hypothetical protein